MIEIPVWVIPTILFILMQGLILLEITNLKNKINNLEFKLNHKLLVSSADAEPQESEE